jgi:hypothetical protein
MILLVPGLGFMALFQYSNLVLCNYFILKLAFIALESLKLTIGHVIFLHPFKAIPIYTDSVWSRVNLKNNTQWYYHKWVTLLEIPNPICHFTPQKSWTQNFWFLLRNTSLFHIYQCIIIVVLRAWNMIKSKSTMLQKKNHQAIMLCRYLHLVVRLSCKYLQGCSV